MTLQLSLKHRSNPSETYEGLGFVAQVCAAYINTSAESRVFMSRRSFDILGMDYFRLACPLPPFLHNGFGKGEGRMLF